MKISARNVFQGKISAVTVGAVNGEVLVTTDGGDSIAAIVTNGSIHKLGLAVGKEVTAFVKASFVLVMTEANGVKLSARNCLTGKISKIVEGPVSAEISIALPGGGAVEATITVDAVVEMGLKVGVEATAVFKASSVILAVAG